MTHMYDPAAVAFSRVDSGGNKVAESLIQRNRLVVKIGNGK